MYIKRKILFVIHLKRDTLFGNSFCPTKMKIPCCFLCSRRSVLLLTKIETVGLWIVEVLGAVGKQPKGHHFYTHPNKTGKTRTSLDQG
jgi:hypothetical protein